MKKTAFVVAALAALTVSALPAAHADGDRTGAAALGFFLGTLLAPTTVVYGTPPAVVYRQPPPVVVRVPDRSDYVYQQTPRNSYFRVRRYEYRNWRDQGHRRTWRGWAQRGDWTAYGGHERHRKDDD